MISRLHFNDRAVDFVHLESWEPSFQFDIRYARSDNFFKQIVYPSAHAFLVEQVAKDLVLVHEELSPQGFGLLSFDGYRPWSVTDLFWQGSNEHDRKFLANPERGSVHNRGCAVDLSMYERASGKAVVMPSDFDEMNEKAFVDYPGGTPESRSLRDLLQKTMKAHSFQGIPNEWWHFNHSSLKDYPVMNFTFDEILEAREKLD